MQDVMSRIHVLFAVRTRVHSVTRSGLARTATKPKEKASHLTIVPKVAARSNIGLVQRSVIVPQQRRGRGQDEGSRVGLVYAGNRGPLVHAIDAVGRTIDHHVVLGRDARQVAYRCVPAPPNKSMNRGEVRGHDQEKCLGSTSRQHATVHC